MSCGCFLRSGSELADMDSDPQHADNTRHTRGNARTHENTHQSFQFKEGESAQLIDAEEAMTHHKAEGEG